MKGSDSVTSNLKDGGGTEAVVLGVVVVVAVVVGAVVVVFGISEKEHVICNDIFSYTYA